ncbi:putative secondary metabolism biosynthetic enzyme [Lepraria neglecta]|uniref:Secondary metabolism biosynthetic enzyme n=1 Tax=Lepraria neglecta TaxID=209136 RepID=A0AAE0DHV0_9LECA|nr:putative secondary metabolism biosynthetic enzyme [Lepraria neglecta]
MPTLTWLVTGCSSGFGEEFVHSILARGDRVIATGRNAASRLQHFKDTGATIMDLDVTAPQADLDKKMAEALAIHGGIDVLVNNAGYIESGPVEELTPERLLRQYNTNVFGQVNLTRSILPHYREKRAGILAFIGSQAGWQGEAGTTCYCSSKFALEVESLQKEIEVFGIKCIIFEPGFYRTKAFSAQNFHFNVPRIPEYAEFNKGLRGFIEACDKNQPGDPTKFAERVIDVIKGEGLAEGKDMPIRLPLGSDGLEVMRRKCLETLKLCEEWEKLIVSTDYPVEKQDEKSS